MATADQEADETLRVHQAARRVTRLDVGLLRTMSSHAEITGVETGPRRRLEELGLIVVRHVGRGPVRCYCAISPRGHEVYALVTKTRPELLPQPVAGPVTPLTRSVTTTRKKKTKIMRTKKKGLGEHGRGLVRQMLKRCKDRWGAGWMLLSQDQREAYVGYEVAMLLLTQSEEVAPAGSPMSRLQEIARAAFEEIAP